MTEPEAIELLMAAPVTVSCFDCGGHGFPPDARRVKTYSKSKQHVLYSSQKEFCKACKGARIVVNPIWKQAWMVLYPDDYEGMHKAMVQAVTKAWKERNLYP